MILLPMPRSLTRKHLYVFFEKIGKALKCLKLRRIADIMRAIHALIPVIIPDSVGPQKGSR
jgi:hypothetical protein